MAQVADDLVLATAQLAGQRLKRRLERPRDTLGFAKAFRGFRHEPPWFHVEWYAAFDDPTKTPLFVQGPREHAKTSSILTWVLRQLCERHHIRVGVVSGTDDLAQKFVREISYELETNQDLIDIYDGPFVGETWTRHELVLRDAREGPDGIAGKDVSLFAASRGGQISSRHCDILIIDDVETKDTVQSELVRKGTREWWTREVMPVLSPGGRMIVTGTRKHFDDLYSYFLLPGTGWFVLDRAKKVYLNEEIAAELGVPAGSPIWPEMWDAAALRTKKALLDQTDILAWSQEYLNEPLPSETQMFYPDRWPTYVGDPHDLARDMALTIIQFWDLAISEKTTADYTVGWTIGVSDHNDVYLLERRRGHWDFGDTLAQISAMGGAWPAVAAVGIEQVAYQAAAVQEAIRRTMLPIMPIIPDKDKVTRARLAEARAAALKIHRPADVWWWSEFATEAVYFPAGAHDDQIDALAGALRLAGWDANSVQYAYGVITCLRCHHMFMWSAGRPCPKCSLPAPDVYANPEGEGLEIKPEGRVA